MLKADKLPSIDLVEAIAVAKVKAVEETIALTHRLKNEVGSYALMADTGFGQSDFLQCCKFAEGDSRILMQKMARDSMKRFTKEHAAATRVDSSWDAETTKCFELQQAIMKEVARNGGDKLKAWDANWKLVYDLANVHMQRVMSAFVGP
jgi:acyl-CoA oxidase